MTVLQVLQYLSLFLTFGHLVDAAECNADNVDRGLRRGGPLATTFCKSLIYYDVPTVTVVPPPGQTLSPKVVTSTSTLTRTAYPGGRTLESVSFPSFVSAFVASRVSSGCSCFLGPAATTTLTASGPTIVGLPQALLKSNLPYINIGPSQTQTTVTTKISFLGGACATPELFAAERYIPGPGQNVVVQKSTISNPYACCRTCRQYRPGLCLAYFNIPGDSCNLLTENITPENPPFCPNVLDGASFFVFINRYPNRIGGRGVCGVNFSLFP